jgi:hypothetical protein
MAPAPGKKTATRKPAVAEGVRKPARRAKDDVVPAHEGSSPVLSPGEAQSLTPLDIMLRAMREHFAAGRLEAAVAIAKEAAPYVHGKLSASAQGAGSSLVRLEWIDPATD